MDSENAYNNDEAAAGGLAAASGATSQLRAFGSAIAIDADSAGTQLRTAAVSWSVFFPTGPDSAFSLLRDRCTTLTGVAFDSAWLQDAISSRRRETGLLETEAAQGRDSLLVRYTSARLSVTRTQLLVADSLLVSIRYPRRK